MSTGSLTYLKINLWDWINKTIAKINPNCTKKEWDDAWLETYFNIGDKSHNSGTKDCPKNAAYCLYKLGRIKGTNIPYKTKSYLDIFNKYGRNALYAIIAYDLLKDNRTLALNDLWQKVRNIYKKEIGKEAAKSNQGAVTVTFKLFHNNKLNLYK